ncbi:MAG TPA: hypothetical protein VGF45_05350, partial [Polyangia bacterium]
MTSDTILFHELVHADEIRRGLLDPHDGLPSWSEERATGLGDFRGGPFTENAYRVERGLPERPFYTRADEPRTHNDPNRPGGRGFEAAQYFAQPSPLGPTRATNPAPTPPTPSPPPAPSPVASSPGLPNPVGPPESAAAPAGAPGPGPHPTPPLATTADFPGNWARDVQPDRLPRGARWRLRLPGNPVGRAVPIVIPGADGGTYAGEVVARYHGGNLGVRWDDGRGVWSGVLGRDGRITIDGHQPAGGEGGGTQAPGVARLTYYTEIRDLGVFIPGASRPGHTYVGLSFNNPNDIPAHWETQYPALFPLLVDNRLQLGRYQQQGGNLGLGTRPGVLRQQQHHGSTDPTRAQTGSQSYDLTLAQAEDVLQYFQRTQNDDYNLCTANCTTWAGDAVRASGHRPPDARFFGVPVPQVAHNNIRRDEAAGRPGAQTAAVSRTKVFRFRRGPDGVDRPVTNWWGKPKVDKRVLVAVPLPGPTNATAPPEVAAAGPSPPSAPPTPGLETAPTPSPRGGRPSPLALPPPPLLPPSLFAGRPPASPSSLSETTTSESASEDIANGGSASAPMAP